jgi:hypothetical protein
LSEERKHRDGHTFVVVQRQFIRTARARLVYLCLVGTTARSRCEGIMQTAARTFTAALRHSRSAILTASSSSSSSSSGRRLSYTARSDAEVAEAAARLSGWNVVKGSERTALSKSFVFGTFVEAWSFMTSVALQVRAPLCVVPAKCLGALASCVRVCVRVCVCVCCARVVGRRRPLVG